MKATRHPLQRFHGRRDLHFVTFSCYRRRPYLGTVRARNRFVQILDEVRSRHAFALIGYVVMPEHVHLLISEPPKGNPSKVLQVLKQKVSHSLRGKRLTPLKQLRFPFSAAEDKSPAFWQRRFYDFNVWTEKKDAGKTDLHAQKPDSSKTRHSSEGLAVEQLVPLCQTRARLDHHRFARRKNKPKRKSAP